MISYLEQPAAPSRAILLAFLLLLGGGLYCSLYNLLQGRTESPLVGMAWSAVNLLPWLAAFELCKRIGGARAGSRAEGWWRIGLVMLGAAAVSIALDSADGLAGPLAFEALRRLPAAVLVLVLLVLAPLVARRRLADSPAQNPRLPAEAPDRLPLLPRQIDWIKAAGNYLEFRSGTRIVLHRMTMAEAEALLEGEGFIRIHRSFLVNASRVVRVARGKAVDEIGLADGTRLRVGAAYRPFVARLEPRAGS